MSARSLSLLSASALVVVAAVGSLSPASAGHGPAIPSPRSGTSHSSPSSEPDSTCYVQGSANGLGEVSQNFEAAYDSFDSRGADDFRLTSTCTVHNVSVKGDYFNGSGPADSINVVIYRDGGGLPGAIVREFAHRAYSDPSGYGNFSIGLPATVLQPGLYWLSVRANMDYKPNGEWEWSTSYNRHNNAPVWKNTGNGFGTGCTSYQPLLNCGFDEEDGGQSFSFTIG